jgi:hypothetical protein
MSVLFSLCFSQSRILQAIVIQEVSLRQSLGRVIFVTLLSDCCLLAWFSRRRSNTGLRMAIVVGAQPGPQNNPRHCCLPWQDQASNQQERIFFPATRLRTASLSPMMGRLT